MRLSQAQKLADRVASAAIRTALGVKTDTEALRKLIQMHVEHGGVIVGTNADGSISIEPAGRAALEQDR